MAIELIATEYQILEQHEQMVPGAVTFCRMNSPFYEGERWAVRYHGMCLGRNLEWEFEPIPSSRTDRFYDNCRFLTLADATWAYERQTDIR